MAFSFGQGTTVNATVATFKGNMVRVVAPLEDYVFTSHSAYEALAELFGIHGEKARFIVEKCIISQDGYCPFIYAGDQYTLTIIKGTDDLKFVVGE